jgi:hypothetical protein
MSDVRQLVVIPVVVGATLLLVRGRRHRRLHPGEPLWSRERVARNWNAERYSPMAWVAFEVFGVAVGVGSVIVVGNLIGRTALGVLWAAYATVCFAQAWNAKAGRRSP